MKRETGGVGQVLLLGQIALLGARRVGSHGRNGGRFGLVANTSTCANPESGLVFLFPTTAVLDHLHCRRLSTSTFGPPAPATVAVHARSPAHHLVVATACGRKRETATERQGEMRGGASNVDQPRAGERRDPFQFRSLALVRGYARARHLQRRRG